MLEEVGEMATEQGSASASVVLENYLSVDRRRELRGVYMREQFADTFDLDGQLARLFQIGIVLEEIVEARAYQHYREPPADDRDETIKELFDEVREKSAEHRERQEMLVERFDADELARYRTGHA